MDNSKELVRYCPKCACVGEVPASARDCCPDGSAAVMIPAEVASQARSGFMTQIQAMVNFAFGR